MSFVYFMQGTAPGFWGMKIGYAVFPYNRAREVRKNLEDQFGKPALVEIVAMVPGGRTEEKQLHVLFKKQRKSDAIGREWFNLCLNDVERFVLYGVTDLLELED